MPDGSAESFTDAVSWVACNLEYAPAQWSKVRQRAASYHIKVIPWIRLCHVHLGENFETIKQRLALLVSTAISWDTDTIIPNYEDEADHFAPADVADHLYGFMDWDGLTGWSTQAWLPNGPDFSAMAKRGDPALLQIFPADNHWPTDRQTVEQKLGDCVWHARIDKKFLYVGVTYQTYAGVTPASYDCESWQHSTFPGNNINHGEWANWYR